jgi:Xaa-Pro aminopeptidase
MDWRKRIADVQQLLANEKVDGWLLYDFHGANPLAREFLNINPQVLTSRCFFYWIPARGEPVKILHAIEPHVLSHLPGIAESYLKWQDLETQLGKVLKGSKTVAMEYSPKNAIPYLSKVDAGTVELIRSFHIDVVSSASLLQSYTCVLDTEQLALHLEAAEFANKVVAMAWHKISGALRSKTPINEYQVRTFIAEQMEANGFMTESLPICAVNAHSADPHFEPLKNGSSEIKKGDFVLIDLWCKKKHPRAVYADIARVAVADTAATKKQTEIFSIVRTAQKTATDFVISKYAKGESIKGYQVDQICRKVIEDKGYGKYFIHRTGHNIYTEVHGPGAHIDSLETQDTRELIPHTCYSIEPGIYLPGEFGVRLEYDIYLGDKGKVQVTGGIQDELLCLLT